MRTVLATVLFSTIFFTQATAGELRHTWRSPAFSGAGYSSHVLTIENLTHQRKADIKAKEESARREAVREAENTNINKFMKNFESRVYAELSKQLSEKLFGESASSEGTIEILGNTIDYTSDGTNLTMTVTEASGTTTTLTVPLTGFGF